MATGRMNLYQLALLKAGGHGPGLPLTRDDWYASAPAAVIA
jgi:hypothetical protein